MKFTQFWANIDSQASWENVSPGGEADRCTVLGNHDKVQEPWVLETLLSVPVPSSLLPSLDSCTAGQAAHARDTGCWLPNLFWDFRFASAFSFQRSSRTLLFLLLRALYWPHSRCSRALFIMTFFHSHFSPTPYSGHFPKYIALKGLHNVHFKAEAPKLIWSALFFQKENYSVPARNVPALSVLQLHCQGYFYSQSIQTQRGSIIYSRWLHSGPAP